VFLGGKRGQGSESSLLIVEFGVQYFDRPPRIQDISILFSMSPIAAPVAEQSKLMKAANESE
jgi:hypothetical protein